MKRFLYISCTFLLVSCYNIDGPKKPDNLIAEDKMVDIIIDMSLFNSAKGINKRLLENQNLDVKAFIYKKHNIDSAQFAQSNVYYANSIEDYDAIYDKVKDSLTKLKGKYSKIEREEKSIKKKKDSIRRAKRKDSVFKGRNRVSFDKDHGIPAPKKSELKVSKKPE